MESLAELRLIEGWDEEMHMVFSPYLTIYPFPKNETDAQNSRININTAHKALLGCLLPQAKVDCNEKFQLKMAERARDGGAIASDRQGIKQALNDVFCAGSPDDNGRPADANENWFTSRSTVFRVAVTGEVAFKEKKLEVVVERAMPDKSKKIESSYRILYWRMI
jgi:type II secretory pathway component PulK